MTVSSSCGRSATARLLASQPTRGNIVEYVERTLASRAEA